MVMGLDRPVPRCFRDGDIPRHGSQVTTPYFSPQLLGRCFGFHAEGPGIGEVDQDRLELPFGHE